ncbi:MAG: VOC family protein [Armatimonadetes bacterium]|nr:VOC family protein [Armatimonadota bacterium]
MTQIHAYLTFSGNCREAMTFYKDCLGGELTLQTVADSPIADQMPAEARQGILHSTLTRGALVLMASDMARDPVVQGNAVTLMLDCSSEEEIHRFFDALSSCGTVICPLEEAFWGATFGALTDKYGIHWALNYDKAPKA